MLLELLVAASGAGDSFHVAIAETGKGSLLLANVLLNFSEGDRHCGGCEGRIGVGKDGDM